MSVAQLEQTEFQPATRGVVLVVDDNVVNRILLREMLSPEGYKVLTATDGAEAIEIFKAEHIDFVLMDVMMPVLNGYEATRIIKQKCKDCGCYCPVLFVTALVDESSLAECVDCGGDGFIVKPYNRVILRAKMRALERTRDLYALVRAQKHELEAHHEQLRHEHDVAERTLSKLMQACYLDAPNLRHLLAPVGLASGDLLLAEYRPDGVQHVLLGDFTGHGLAAAMGAIPVADVFQSMTRKGLGIDAIAAEINRKLKSKLPVGLFLAGCLLAVDPSSGSVCIWNGGIPEVLIRRAGSGDMARLPSRHLPLGILDDALFDAGLDRADAHVGDCIYAYSDGLIEAVNPQDEMFGEARLESALMSVADRDPFAEICARLDRFRAGQPQNDDITLIEIEYPPPVFASIKDQAAAVGTPDLSTPATVDADRMLSVSFDCGVSRLRQDDVQNILIRFLESLPELEQERGKLYTVIAELYNNALDHGLLCLDSALKSDAEGFAEYYRQRDERLAGLTEGAIKISLRLSGTVGQGQVVVTIEDSGDGFDHAAAVDQQTFSTLSRRGIYLVKSICSHVHYHGAGNHVEAVYVWPRSDA